MQEAEMRTLLDIPERSLEELNQMASARKISRAALMREAIEDYLTRNRSVQQQAAFGLWSTGENGRTYQERMREEW